MLSEQQQRNPNTRGDTMKQQEAYQIFSFLDAEHLLDRHISHIVVYLPSTAPLSLM